MESQQTASPKLFIGIDIHKRSWKVHCATDLFAGKSFSTRPDPGQLRDYISKHFPGHEVSTAYEAGCCGYSAHRSFESYGWRSLVVNPADIHRKGKERHTKTDKIDARLIARELKDGRLDCIHVPDIDREELRSLFRRRNDLVKDFRRIKSYIKMQLLYFGIKEPQEFDNDSVRLQGRLWKEGLVWENCVADTGYSSGENYAFLEDRGLKSFIPPHGTYKGGPDGFEYIETADHYLCPQGKIIPFKKVFLDHRTKTRKKAYRASSKICKGCPLRETCLGKVNEKQFSVTYYRKEYERNIERVNSREGRYMKGKRQSTVEPVFGTLTQFMGLRKINTIGLEQANKVMHLSAIAYNLKKYLKFEQKRAKSGVGIFALAALVKSTVQFLFGAYIKHRKLAYSF